MKTFNSIGIQRVSNQNHTSRGDQLKWYFNEEWYKADYMGYEALSEVIVSELLKKSNITNYVRYEPVKIRTDKEVVNGCVSTNFKKDNETVITLEKLHRSYFGVGLADQLSKMKDIAERVKYTVDFTEAVTGLENFDKYLTAMLEMDALFLNEDRHTNNIAVIREESTKAYRFCPYFDNGLSLLSDLNDYPLEKDIYKLINSVKAKPFSISFDEQVDAAESLYGIGLHLGYPNSGIENTFATLKDWYPSDILSRVKTVVLERKRKYALYFS